MVTAYETAARIGSSKSYVEQAIKGMSEEKKKREATERAFLGPAYDGIPEAERSEAAAVIAQDPNLRGFLDDHVNEYKRQSEECDLEAIIDSAPDEVVQDTVLFMDYNFEGDVDDKKIRMYHAFLNLDLKIKKTQRASKEGINPKKFAKEIGEKAESYEDLLEKLQNKARILAMNRYKTLQEGVEDEYTRNFLMKFADAVVESDNDSSVKYSLGKFQSYLEEASKYVSDKSNVDELRSYLKSDIPEGDRAKLYDIITMPRGEE